MASSAKWDSRFYPTEQEQGWLSNEIEESWPGLPRAAFHALMRQRIVEWAQEAYEDRYDSLRVPRDVLVRAYLQAQTEYPGKY